MLHSIGAQTKRWHSKQYLACMGQESQFPEKAGPIYMNFESQLNQILDDELRQVIKLSEPWLSHIRI